MSIQRKALHRLLNPLLALVLALAPVMVPAPVLAGGCDHADTMSGMAMPGHKMSTSMRQHDMKAGFPAGRHDHDACCCDGGCESGHCGGHCLFSSSVSTLPDNFGAQPAGFSRCLFLASSENPLAGREPRPHVRPPRLHA